MGDMLRKCGGGRGGSMDEQRRRSIIEAVPGAISTMYGNRLRSTGCGRQGRETAARVTCCSIEVAARGKAENGRLAPGSAAALPA